MNERSSLQQSGIIKHYALSIVHYALRSLFPSSAENFIEVDEGEVLVSYSIADPDLSVKIATLCVEYVNVAESSATILQKGKLHIFCGSISKIDL